MSIDPDVIFHEEQRFNRWFFLIASAALVAVLLAVGHSIYSGDFSKPGFARPAAIIVIVELALIWLLMSVKMVTEVRRDSVTVSAWPIRGMRRVIPISEIKRCEARTYSPLREYGGWGIRFGAGGKAYNMSGNRGVQLEFKSDDRLLIGSQKADELASAIRSGM